MTTIMTVYFSHRGENYFGGTIRSISKGNTETAAEYIQKAVGGKLFEIETVQAYPQSYKACTDAALSEKNSQARPELKAYCDDVNDADILFVGYPNWWGTCPMAVFTFLEHYDLSGKKIVPFCTNEGSGMGSSESDLRRICKGAEVVKGLAIRGSDAGNSEKRIADWAKNNI